MMDERRPLQGDERRAFLEGKRERAEALIKKVGQAKGLNRDDVIKKVIGKAPPAYNVRGPR
jgi:hypothetical protein